MAFTKDELDQMKSVVSLVIHKEMSDQEIKFEKQVRKFKSDLSNKLDDFIEEVRDSRTEQKILSRKQSEHSDAIEALKKIHPQGKHTPVSL